MLGKQKCYPLCVLSLHLSQEVSDCVMKARLTGVQFKDAQYSQYTLQSSFTLDVHFPPDVGNIDGPIDWFEGCGDCTGVPAGPSSQRSSSRGCCQPCQTGKDIYPYSPPPPPVAVVSWCEDGFYIWTRCLLRRLWKQVSVCRMCSVKFRTLVMKSWQPGEEMAHWNWKGFPGEYCQPSGCF